jgi:uncharacterized protein (TIGR02266 family)
MKENRRYERINKALKSEVHSDEGMLFSTTRDLSKGGIFISTPEPVRVGSEIMLSIIVKDGDEIGIKGVVRWISEDNIKDNKSGMGIEFLEMSEEIKQKMKSILS